MCTICLGVPPETFDWEYYDKNKAYHCIKGITPYDFYHKHIKQIFNVKDKVSIPFESCTWFSVNCQSVLSYIVVMIFCFYI